MKKIFCLFLLFISLAQAELLAQWTLELEAGGVFPLGDLARRLETGIGGDAGVYYRFDNNLRLGLGLGYYAFRQETDDLAGEELRSSIVPLTLRLAYWLGDEAFEVMGQVEAGLYLIGFRSLQFASNQSIVSNEGRFGIAPKLGMRVGLSPRVDFFFSASFHYLFREAVQEFYIRPGVGVLIHLGN